VVGVTACHKSSPDTFTGIAPSSRFFKKRERHWTSEFRQFLGGGKSHVHVPRVPMQTRTSSCYVAFSKNQPLARHSVFT
jgi:hypothetical protein